MQTDRPVLLLVVCLNAAALLKFNLSSDTLIGAINGTLAAALLAASVCRSEEYSRRRLVPVVLLRLLICLLPLVSDTVNSFPAHELSCSARQLVRGTFMLLVGISWSVGLFIATFLLLPPPQHLAVQTVSLALLFANNGPVCERFLAQHPANTAIIEALDAGLRALLFSVAPVAQEDVTSMETKTSKLASCMAGATAMQVGLGLVLPTMLAWQLQSRIVRTPQAPTPARRRHYPNRIIAPQPQHSSWTQLCEFVTRNTQGCMNKLLITAGSMMLGYIACLVLLVRA